jgi:hypothetical protein
MNQETRIELFNSIGSEKISSLGRDLFEVGLDQIVNEGVLREIPVVNSLYNLGKATVAISQGLFIKKLIKFLGELSNVSYEKRQSFLEVIDKNPQKKRAFEETLLLLIDRADSLEKPSILGRLLKHHILGNISYEDAMRLSDIVNRVYMSDLNYLTRFSSDLKSNPDIAASLQSAGLLKLALSMDFGYLGQPSPAGIIYELNEYGKMLLQYGLDSAV